MTSSDGHRAGDASRKPPRLDRQTALRFGVSAETRAVALLVIKGYRIAARRWRCPVGEIDVVARRGRALVFVEVKARARLDDAAEALTIRQRRRIVAAAQAWLARHPEDAGCDLRFDAILVAPGRWPQHIVGAFDAGL